MRFETVSVVFGIPEEDVGVLVSRARDVIDDRLSRGRVGVRRIDNVWPVARAVARLVSRARVSLSRSCDSPWEALEAVLGEDGPDSPTLSRLRSIVEGRAPRSFPVLGRPDCTIVAWSVRDEDPVRELGPTLPAVTGLVGLCVLEESARRLVERFGEESARGLSTAFTRYHDERTAVLLGAVLGAWLWDDVDDMRAFWEEGGGWRFVYRFLREGMIVEGVVEELTGIEPGSSG